MFINRKERSMEIKIISKTMDMVEDNQNNKSTIDSMLTLGGREAGICYMAEDYFSNKINNSKAALKRANVILNSGHHSPFDHASIGLEISGIPKIVAMILNSTEWYTTSEKSARYTVMDPDTDVELEIYNKWREIFRSEIAKLDLGLTEKEMDKLALENARYMLSVFTPTSMGFTTTFRQYSYLSIWLEKLVNNLKSRPNLFNNKLIEPCSELSTYFKSLTSQLVPDYKDGMLQFLPNQYGYKLEDSNHISDIYSITYYMSFAGLAQSQRHRTLHYELGFSGDIPGEYGAYIPKIIRSNEKLSSEWKTDFDKIKDKFPQCTLVKTLEQGRVYWFLMKSKERLCGRAQLEIQERTAETMRQIISNKSNLSKFSQLMLSNYTNDDTVVPKCKMHGYICHEPCKFGPEHGVNRII